MKFYSAVMAALVLSACHPNDAKIKTVKERIDAGEIVVFSEPGTKLATCKTTPDWTAFLGMQKDERERSVLGKQQSVISPGNRACYRIGSRVSLDSKKPANGSVFVRSIALGRLDKVRQDNVKGRFFSFREEFNSYLSGVKTRMGGKEAGYIYIVTYGYSGGSAVDEKAIKDRDTGPDYDETLADGKDLDGCNAQWTDMQIATDYLQPIEEGKIKSWFKLGRMNCLKQGQTAELKDTFGEGSKALAVIKIKKVKRFKIAFLEARYFELNGYDFTNLQKYITDQVKLKPAEYMTVVDFDVVNASTPAATPQANCPSAIYLTRSYDQYPEGKIVVGQASARCATVGYITKVITVLDDGSTEEIPVRIKARLDQSAYATLTLERLDQPLEVAQ